MNAELKRLAEAATPGRWVANGMQVNAKELGWARIADTEFDYESMAENAAYIAAASPDAILSLIADLEKHRALMLEHLAVIDPLKAEIAVLKEMLAGEITSTSIAYAGDFVGLEGGFAPLLIEMFAAQFKESHAENYLELSFKSSKILPSESFIVRVQKVSGKTPHALRLEAEEQRDALKTERDRLREALKDAAQSLETIASLAGRKTYNIPPVDTCMGHFDQVRGYAASRAGVARQALGAQ